ncbi:MAG: hypothetical protein U1F08_05180 [Steroidobacteraceae bacterium]
MKLRLAFTLALAIGPIGPVGAAVLEARFAVPRGGDIVMQLPDDWSSRADTSNDNLSTTITLVPKSGDPFQIQVTPMAPTQGGPSLPSAADLRHFLEQNANGIRAQSVESEIRINELAGASGPGYYYSATDKAPTPGSYAHMTQGVLRVDGLVVTFTILTNDGQSAVVEQALTALKTARQVGP